MATTRILFARLNPEEVPLVAESRPDYQSLNDDFDANVDALIKCKKTLKNKWHFSYLPTQLFMPALTITSIVILMLNMPDSMIIQAPSTGLSYLDSIIGFILFLLKAISLKEVISFGLIGIGSFCAEKKWQRYYLKKMSFHEQDYKDFNALFEQEEKISQNKFGIDFPAPMLTINCIEHQYVYMTMLDQLLDQIEHAQQTLAKYKQYIDQVAKAILSSEARLPQDLLKIFTALLDDTQVMIAHSPKWTYLDKTTWKKKYSDFFDPNKLPLENIEPLTVVNLNGCPSPS